MPGEPDGEGLAESLDTPDTMQAEVSQSDPEHPARLLRVWPIH